MWPFFSLTPYWPGQIWDSLFCCHKRLLVLSAAVCCKVERDRIEVNPRLVKIKSFPCHGLFILRTHAGSSERPPPPHYYQNDWLHLQLQQIFLVISLIEWTVRAPCQTYNIYWFGLLKEERNCYAYVANFLPIKQNTRAKVSQRVCAPQNVFIFEAKQHSPLPYYLAYSKVRKPFP